MARFDSQKERIARFVQTIEASPSEIAAALQIAPDNLAQYARQLRQEGRIESVPDPRPAHDGRPVRYRATTPEEV